MLSKNFLFLLFFFFGAGTFSCKKGGYIDDLLLNNSKAQQNVGPEFDDVLNGPTGFNVQLTNSNGLSQISPIPTLPPEESEVDARVDLSTLYESELYRMTISKKLWENKPNNQDKWLYEYQQASEHGMGICVNLINNPSPEPVEFTTDLPGFTLFVESFINIISSHNLPLPMYIVVENEETNYQKNYDYDPSVEGDPDDDDPVDPDDESEVTTTCDKYLAQLNAVLAICAPYGIVVMNGGFTTIASNFLTYEYLYLDFKNQGYSTTKALNLTKSVFGDISMPPHNQTEIYNYIKKRDDNNPTNNTWNNASIQLTMCKYYKSQYISIKGMYGDFFSFNFHWYEPSKARGWQDSRDGGPAFTGTNPLVSPDEMSGGLPSVLNQFKLLSDENGSINTNEVGMMTTSDNLLDGMMETLRFKLGGGGAYNGQPYIGASIWFDGDGHEPTNPYKAKPLHNTEVNYSPPHIVSNADLTTLGIYLVNHRWYRQYHFP